ncbi:hypothetical protein OG863_40400 [Streptomyces decoyicus]|uniref:Secreted protein n=1 Tax=Streptomyces decoyicus TaxID=249567 RepID=A0ABZ1FUU2_9ACTN|nr:hypothetical protein [Streptomyces decoyicus]WSB73697.1 hypothetical protein OG863_40400 [Streptomyces decoyicus]
MNTETMVALIGAAGVLGTIGGTVVGARIQANGGHAQAQAARDAAATAAQAARGQALGERRWAVLTAYLRAADLCVDVVSQSYDAGFLTENDSAYKVFVLAQAEAELAAPTSMDTHLAEMHNAVRNVWSTADIWAPHGWGWRALAEMAQSGRPEAEQARTTLHRVRGEGPRESRTLAQLRAEHEELRTALEALPRFGTDQVSGLLRDRSDPDRAGREQRWREQHYVDVREKLIEAARDVLGTNQL